MNKLSELLRNKINITSEMEAKANCIYEEVSNLLQSKLKQYDPDIFVQGSFKLKTIIKPVQSDEYDLDFVCHLKINKDQISHAELKELVGNALKTKYSIANGQLEPKNRCWRINLDGFHVDVLPAVPETDLSFYGELVGTALIEAPIAIPDKDLKEWKSSNPRGYAIWFKEQERKEETKRASIIENSKEVLPRQNVGVSVLQNAIKVMKYHRDIQFKDNLENKPISIILTTLAATYYDGEQNLEDALYGIVNRIKLAFPSIFDAGQIRNPVLPTENFADKWATHPERKRAFKEWVLSLHTLLEEYVLNKDKDGSLQRLLVEGFGVSHSAVAHARNLSQGLAAGALSLGLNNMVTSASKAAGYPTKFYGTNGE